MAPLSDREAAPGGVLVVVGSDKPAARALVERLLEDGALVLTLKRDAVLAQDETYLLALAAGAAVAVKQGRYAVVRSENWPGAAAAMAKLAARRLIPAEEVQRRVLAMLARAGEAVVRATNAPVVVVGSDTGEALARQLGASALEMGDRLLLAAGGDPDDGAVALVEAVRQMAAHRPS